MLNGIKFIIEKNLQWKKNDLKNWIQCSYIGASNGDLPEFYEIFVSAMEDIGINKQYCKMIPSKPTKNDKEFLCNSDIILLAGGDCEYGKNNLYLIFLIIFYEGWNIINSNNIKRIIIKKYFEGSILIGISAGAIQLGMKGYNLENNKCFNTFGFVPYIIGVHDEPDWKSLEQILLLPENERLKGIGIPSGINTYWNK